MPLTINDNYSVCADHKITQNVKLSKITLEAGIKRICCIVNNDYNDDDDVVKNKKINALRRCYTQTKK